MLETIRQFRWNCPHISILLRGDFTIFVFLSCFLDLRNTDDSYTAELVRITDFVVGQDMLIIYTVEDVATLNDIRIEEAADGSHTNVIAE